MEPIRVLIADDDPIYRDGLHSLLTSSLETEFIGEANTGDSAVAIAIDLQPDVILMDIKMPGSLGNETSQGIEATRCIIKHSPHISIVMVTYAETDASIFDAMCAGARGYVIKGAGFDEVLDAIRTAHRGGGSFAPRIAARFIDFFQTIQRQPRNIAALFPDLNKRELQILQLMAKGHDNTEIATNLCISPKTVNNNVSNIYSKLQVATRAQAIVLARDAGLF
ncbi:MAG: response regulator transcription factor [Ktedonobacteraceae bacterium]|nr:response regulator transcription factor [Ktedonobacteraceae bacterium]